MAGWRRRGPLTKVPHHNNEIRLNLDLRSTSPRANLIKLPQPDPHHIFQHQPPTEHFTDTLDAPPKYEDIFKGGVHCQIPQQEHQKAHRGTSYEKKRIKSYFLRHLPKPRTPTATLTTSTTRSSTPSRRQHQNIVREEGYINREKCNAEINIPPSSPLDYCSHSSPGAPPPTLHHPQSDHHQFVEMGQRQDHLVQEDCLGEGSGCSNDVGGSRSFTITLKPGRYRVNVQWRSKTHPFRITLTPNKKKRCEAPPPSEQQPLYYSTCESHVEQHTTPSLPRRLVHRLLSNHQTSPPSPSSNCHHQHDPCTLPAPTLQEQLAQHQHSLLQQQVGFNPAACVNRKGQKRCWDGVTPRHRQRKSRLAERKKNEGNELYKAKDYREALKLYTQAIDLCPDCAAYYSNRSACYMMLGKYTEALSDAREAVRLDKSFVKGYLRVAKCNIALGDATAAQSVLRQATELDPANRAIREEAARAQSLLKCQDEVAKATGKADYRTAIFHLDRALDLAVGCRALRITKAEYLVFLHRYLDAQEIVNEILQFDSGNVDAIYVRGMCLYYQDNPDAAFHHFQQVLRLAPDHHKARQVYKKAKLLKQKKEEGNEAFKRGSYQEAYSCYTEALAIDPLNRHTNAKLYFNRATVGSKINKVEEAVEDCTAAINLDEGYVKAYLRRAKCYQQLEKHEEAVRDYEKVTRLDRSQEHKRLLQDAKMQLKRSKRKDYYKILGVSKNASDDEIKKSYRKMALVHHPDRHANASDKDKHDHEVKFKEIGEAYSVLTDGKKRAMYDRGHDLNDPDGGFSHEEIDPNQIFQAFFGGGGHGGYTFGGHGGGFPQGGFAGGSFPGGFHFQFG